ncbi:hypothetical protein M407DRAFT_21096 [Tulasnella calospora MUT 4182]|uniref:F-box domain-containing protein n=1 Tax=Tulasnella calospora MUT 4182 TaxID=1051891 RepID=A0A0C3L7R2_9AGAM|nr:hypothetical protein M407DRAFT_21096 [Tulasnella calospora MUT 4182]
MKKRLSLSGSCPLDVRMCLDSGEMELPTKQFRTAHSVLAHSVDRWRSFVFDGMAWCPEDVSSLIPTVLPNIVEVGYYVCVEDGDEGTVLPDEEDEFIDPPYRSWPIAPKLQKFATTAAGQFHFVGCPLVKEYSVTSIRGSWGDPNLTRRSWQERWRRYILYIHTTCLGIESLEGGTDSGVDTIMPGPVQWIPQEKWNILPRLRRLVIESVGAVTLVSLLAHINAPDLREVRIGFVQEAVPLPVPEFTLSIPSSCKLRFDYSPIRAIKLFLSHITGLDQLSIAVEMTHALQIKGCEHYGFLPYQVPKTEDERIIMDATAFKWVDDHVQSLDLVLQEECEWVPGAEEQLKLQVLKMMILAHRLENAAEVS